MTMNTLKTFLKLTLVAASAASMTVFAAIPNPDNESTTAFAYKPVVGTIRQAAVLAQPGDFSSDGRLVYSGTDRGWVLRAHSFAYVDGSLVHTPDCAPYNEAQAVETSVPIVQSGAFGEHGV
jgi:hypothetical protein